ncbi:uncharacterized protein K460DRAFT_354291 [Cucurbitaria berberidis CBS 394.84]|uniref:Protein kinase domain-containing protein n=1 Tax=Cucurbitaria berberidis CBS 394.84 TaxID=1168544 RepID=A0A9P4GQT8_9PLEO|nr:uncharacterized protein K460DRAFT_354291 [Cucurbitaria berberidis CBS 394.84]KAF1849446.1 hypothetical protein K460DRAFT_354291 [Cucurbitaria berberidis CBS 394.84]
MSTNNVSMIPNGYTLLRRAGQGTQAKVYTCLPNPAITFARNALDDGDEVEHVGSALLSQVVAVKSSYTGSLRAEIRILNAIRTQSSHHKGGMHCTQLLDYERPSASPNWFSMSTTPVCCDLHAFSEQLPGPLPKSVLWLVATQLYDAFWFLHRVCAPPIAHLDVGLSNFTISYPGADSIGAPKITLLDFGAAVIVPEAESLGQTRTREDDVANFCYEIYTLCLECCDGSEEPSGIGAEKMRRFMRIWSDVTNLEQLRVEFGQFAEEQLALVEERDWQEVKDLVLQTVQRVDEQEGSIRDAVLKILEVNN